MGKLKCDKCGGTGEIRNISYIPVLSEVSSIANDWVECYMCHGKGEKICSRCDGAGELSDD
jgi:DnaJ-class molecular chaperone